MRSVWTLTGVGLGESLFTSRAAAEQAAKMIPRDWGRDVGGSQADIREVKLFDSVEEWKSYKGFRW
jgi:hypothetical protein